MQLIINHHTDGGLVTSNGRSVELDKFYDLPDHPGARFIIRARSRASVIIEIKQGKRRAQIGTVQLLSATCGSYLTGGPKLHPYTVELDPARPIWPIGDLVTKLMALGVHDWQISPMFAGETLTTCTASFADSQMLTDGECTGMFREAHTANKAQLLRDLKSRGEPYLEGEEELSDSQSYRVSGSTWAIQYRRGGKISHVYLWMGAAEQAEAICEHVRRLASGVVESAMS